MSNVLAFTAKESPSEYMSRMANTAYIEGHINLAALFNGFADLWAAEPASMGFGVAEPAVTWREANMTHIGRAALALAAEFEDIDDEDEE